MAFSSPSPLLSSTTPNPFSCKSTTSPMASLPPSPLKTFTKTLTIPKSFIGLRNYSFPTRASRTISARTRSSKTSLSVNAVSECVFFLNLSFLVGFMYGMECRKIMNVFPFLHHFSWDWLVYSIVCWNLIVLLAKTKISFLFWSQSADEFEWICLLDVALLGNSY